MELIEKKINFESLYSKCIGRISRDIKINNSTRIRPEVSTCAPTNKNGLSILFNSS